MVISGRDNPKIKRLAKLLSSRKARNEEGCFVIEGMRGCVDAAASYLKDGSIEIIGAFYVPESLDAFSDVLDTQSILALPEKLRFEITREIAEKISDAETSQGIFIAAKRLDRELTADQLKARGRYIVLDGLQDPGNLGTVLRTSDAVGVDGIVLTGHCVDLYNPKVVRSAVGSFPRVNIYVEDDFETVTKLFAEKDIRTAAAVISGGTDILDYDFSEGCAVVIGNEGRGLPEEHIALCTDKVSISMKGSINSLNAAAAATIFLWEMTRGKH